MASSTSSSKSPQANAKANPTGQTTGAYNYTTNCLIHQDYAAIDRFALTYNLNNIKALDTTVITEELPQNLDRFWYPPASTTKARVQEQINTLEAKEATDHTLTDADKVLLRDNKRRLARYDRMDEIRTEGPKAFPKDATIGWSLTALKQVADHHLIDKESEKLMLNEYNQRINKIKSDLSAAGDNQNLNNNEPKRAGEPSTVPHSEAEIQLREADIQLKIDGLKTELEYIIHRRNESPNVTDKIDLNLRPINKLRTFQVKMIGLYLWTKAIEELKLDQDDQVARNRLFYSWVGYSITYDILVRVFWLPDLKKESVQTDRPMADALATGFEICGNFSAVQKIMSNAGLVDATGVDKELATIAVGGSGKDSPRKDIAVQEKLHGWCAFPTSGDTRIPLYQRFKVIDTTYAKIEAGGKASINNLWFTMSNDGLLQDHIPQNPQHQFVRPENTVVDHQQLWDRDLAIFGNLIVESQSIERSSLKPANYILGETKTLAVEFAPACEHYNMPDLYLLVCILKDSKPDTKIDKPVPFSLQDGRWKASFSVTKFPKDGSAHALIVAPYKSGKPLKVDSSNLLDCAADKAREAKELAETLKKQEMAQQEADEMARYKASGTNITEEEERMRVELDKQYEEMERLAMERQRLAEEEEKKMGKGKKPIE
ncbi:MAG: hypothetical protein Q9218_004774 [Villophora microphyllina]